MKHILKKPLGLAAAIAVTLGTLSAPMVANAAAVSANNGGDLALIPYYTTQAGFVTGVVITNRTDKTQIVKFRMRRATDSNDAIDFIIGLSPRDVYTGFIAKDADGNVSWNTNDASCTAPANTNGMLFPSDLAGNNTVPAGGDEGYIEIIGMGETEDELQPVAQYALHNAGVPADCEKFGENFLAPGRATNGRVFGVRNFRSTTNLNGPGNVAPSSANISFRSDYDDTEDEALRVSYFIRDSSSGLEFGNSAVHISDFSQNPMMANQQYGVKDINKFVSGFGTLTANQTNAGYDFPDLNGGSTQNSGTNGLFNDLRAFGVLGTSSISNDWPVNPALGVSTDWAVTFPGQYLMRPVDTSLALATNDDLPVSANISVWDREEGVAPPLGLVVSPGEIVADTATLPYEANIIEWFGGVVLKSGLPHKVLTPAGSTFTPIYGWAEFALTSATMTPLVYNHAEYLNPTESSAPAEPLIPTIGFVAWQRKFANAQNKNYGRIVEHGRKAAQ